MEKNINKKKEFNLNKDNINNNGINLKNNLKKLNIGLIFLIKYIH